MRAVLALVAMIASLASGACAPCRGRSSDLVRSADTTGVEAALRRFLTAFEQLDWKAFRASFADDACVFFPSASTPGRFCGRDAVEERFRHVFDSLRSETPSGPPFQRLVPEDVQIQALGGAASLVSFELRSKVRVARRTVVFQRINGTWLIIHLHASNVPWTD